MATQVKTGLIANNAITDAKIANVALTGVTASSGDSSTSLATTAFVAGEINSLIDSAPGALNTLNELAAAMGDDANFSTTVTNNIATKLPLAGGALTGDLSTNSRVAIGQSSFTGGGVLLDLHSSGSSVGSQAAFYNDHNTSGFFVGIAGNSTGNPLLYNSPDTNIEFYTNSAIAMTITSSETIFAGNVGIGENSPDGELHVKGTGGGNGDVYVERTSGAKIHLQAQSANGKIGTSSNHNLGLNTNGSTRIDIDSGGDVKINTGRLGIGMDAAQALDIDRTSGLSLRFYNSGTFKGGLQAVSGSGQMIGTSAADDFAIRSQSNLLFSSGGNTERMRINSSGTVLVGTGTINPQSASSGSNQGCMFGVGLITAGRAGGEIAIFNRQSSDGDVVLIRKDGSTVGSIATEGGDMAIGNDDAGIQFINGNEHFRPFNVTSNAATNALMDIGSSSYRFKDLFLSGDISIVGGSSGGTITVDPTSGDAELLLQGAAGAQTLRLDQNSIRTSTNSSIAIFTNNLSNRRLHIQNSTNNSSDNLIGIGTSSPQAALHVNGSYNINNNSDAIFLVEKNNGNDWTCRLNHGADDYGYFVQGNGAYAYAVYNQPASAYRARLNFNGELYLNGGSSALYNINSDIRLKEEISDAPSQWELIKGLPLQRFKWIDRREGEKWSYGFIAQEVEKTNPEFVELVPQEKEDEDNGVEDPEYKTVAEGQIHERALAALQEAMKRIEALEAEVKALKGE